MVNPEGLTISYNLHADRLGEGRLVTGIPRVYDYPVVTSIGGRPASSLKAYAYRAGFGFALVEMDLAPDRASPSIDLPFKPLHTIELAGRIVLPEGINADRLDLSVGYMATWSCDFYQLIDCPLGPMPISLTPLAKDVAFAVEVPDFAHDPGLARFESKGDFNLVLRDRDFNIVCWVEPDESDHGDVPVAETYPPDRKFIARAK